MESAEARREAIANALLEVLQEHQEHTSETGQRLQHLFSDWTFRAQLAELIQQTNQGIGLLKERIIRLEDLLQP